MKQKGIRREGGRRCLSKKVQSVRLEAAKPPREQEGGKVPVCDQM
jgi:hypothetical protein